MPGVYNPYTLYPVSYANQMGYAPMPAQQPIPQSYAPQQQQPDDMKWVEGELGAKMFQMPPGWPANKVIMLWDSTDTNIFLKSWGPMGIPNPIQKLHYVMDTQQNEQRLLSGANVNQNAGQQIDPNMFVTKNEFDQLRNDIKELLNNANNNNNASGRMTMTYSGNSAPSQNGAPNNNPVNQNGSNNGNRGGNR